MSYLLLATLISLGGFSSGFLSSLPEPGGAVGALFMPFKALGFARRHLGDALHDPTGAVMRMVFKRSVAREKREANEANNEANEANNRANEANKPHTGGFISMLIGAVRFVAWDTFRKLRPVFLPDPNMILNFGLNVVETALKPEECQSPSWRFFS